MQKPDSDMNLIASYYITSLTHVSSHHKVHYSLLTSIQDLYRWWFRMVCSNGRMRLQARRWGEVVRDPRYEITQG